MRVRPLFIVLGVVVIVPVTLIIALLAVSALNRDRLKDELQTNYETIALPGALSLASRDWDGGGSDVPPHWLYRYTTRTPAAVLYPQIITSLKSAGYTVDFSNDRDANYLTARNSAQRVFLTINLNSGAVSVEVQGL